MFDLQIIQTDPPNTNCRDIEVKLSREKSIWSINTKKQRVKKNHHHIFLSCELNGPAMCPGRGPVGRAQCLKVSPTKEAKRISSSHYVQIQVYSNRLITKISQKHKVIIWANGRCVEVSQFYRCDTCPKSLPLRNLSAKAGGLVILEVQIFRASVPLSISNCTDVQPLVVFIPHVPAEEGE